LNYHTIAYFATTFSDRSVEKSVFKNQFLWIERLFLLISIPHDQQLNYQVKKALIVEDFRPIAEIWKKALLLEKYTEIEITDTTDQLEALIASFQPDLVFMDINLKGNRDGIETVTELIPQFPSLNVLFLSMHGQPHMMEKAMKAGAKGYMTKSSPLTEIKTAVQHIESGNLYICDQMRIHWKTD
jgi:DNA-binding NarL/FixJ family response regulator